MTQGPTAKARRLVVGLDEVGRDDLELAGGKGANLGELIGAGFKVPPGFVATTAAYHRFVELNALQAVVERGHRDGNMGAVRAAFESAPIPDEVGREIRQAYEQLGRGPVAVRSSATAEDLPGAAFAGQQDTFLNVTGEPSLLEAVRRCWASLWTDRAVDYRNRLDLDHWTVSLAVVVQRMVPADAAGVLFTANPVSGMRNEVLIDANPGLGDAVVSGLVTPDHFVLRRALLGWRVVERRRGNRELIVRASAAGGTEHRSPLPSETWSLPDAALIDLASLGRRIERHFGMPQDIEWAWADDRVAIVQARPITALPQPPPRPGRVLRLFAGLVAELLPARPYPLEMTTWVPTVFGFLRTFFAVLGLRTRPLDELFVEADDVVVRLSGRSPIRPTPAVLLTPIRMLRLARRYDPKRWREDPLLPEAQERARALERRDLNALSWVELLAVVREALAIPGLIWKFRVRYLIRPMLAVARLRLALTVLGRTSQFGDLLFTGIETRTLEANRGLEDLAAAVRSDPWLADKYRSQPPEALWSALESTPAGRVFLERVKAFLGDYGHRETGGTMQISAPTWKDAPEVVMGIIQGIAAGEPHAASPPPKWEQARDMVLSHPLLRSRRLRSAFLVTLDEARLFPQLREDTRFYFMLPAPVLRRSLLELGRRLAEAGALDTANDVFHLRLDELERAGGRWPPSSTEVEQLRANVARRQAKRAELESTPLVDPRLLRGPQPTGDVVVRGIPGSPGVAEGPVRIVRDASAFASLRSGEVLVAPFTNPAWTPLFRRAAAVVVDSGGAASHAAIVAREYGIPAVMATVDGTQRLLDGRQVRVDGSEGLVFAVTGPDGAARRPVDDL